MVDVLDGLDSMPQVQEHAIAAAQEQEAEQTAVVEQAAQGRTDRHGRPFDPKIHEVDKATGEPRLSANGLLCVKRGQAKINTGGRISATAGNASFTAPKPKAANAAQAPQPTAAEIEAKIKATAQVTAECVFTLGQLVGGEEWKPQLDKASGTDERAIMVGAWAEYYRAHGITQIPPWAGLAMALGGYAVPRFFMPKTKSRMQKAKEWIYAQIAKRKARRGFADFVKGGNSVSAAERDALREAALIHPSTP